MLDYEVAAIDREGRAFGHGSLGVVAIGGGLAQAGVSYSFPLSVVSEVVSLCFNLTTDGNVANRQVSVQLLDGFAVPIYGVAAPGVQAATLDVLYSFGPLVTSGGTSAIGMQTGPLPYGRLPANISLSVQVANAAAGDLVTDARMLVRQWPFAQDTLGGSATG